MRIAALYDIHGNLPALDAVLLEVTAARVDAIVVGGDVVVGPMTRDVIARLLDVENPVHFIQGNAETAVLAAIAGRDSGVPEAFADVMRWEAEQLREYESLLVAWPKTLRLHTDSGEALFCHATPRDENEVFTKLTPEGSLLPIFDAAGVPLVVCGHTHMQFDRTVGTTRVVNAGSVGMPFGEPGAYWLLVDDAIHLQRTAYDRAAAAERIRATAYPQAETFAATNVLAPMTELAMLEMFEAVAVR